MIIAFIIISGSIAVLFKLSASKYSELLKTVDVNFYRMKPLLPVGMYIMEAAGYSYTTSYDRKLLSAIIELSEPKQAQDRLKLHWGNKVVYLLLGLLFVLFVGAFSEPDAGFAVFAAAIIGGVLYISDKELFDRIKARRASIRMDFPDFAGKLVLLINAGLTVTRAWDRIAGDTSRDSPLYRELRLAMQEIKAGKPEHSAYEEFAKRCRTPEITRFISVILQNLRKGNSELVPVLRVFAMECWEMRKNTARRIGEEASTKMLLPLMLMFLAILLIVGTPAVLALRNI